MKRIGVFSDTHGNTQNLAFALQQAGRLDAFLHLGDYADDAAVMAEQMNIPGCAVRGNCDFYAKAPAERLIEYEDASLLLVHGDAFRDVYQLAARAEQNHCDAVLFGHTHRPFLTAQGPLLIVNPGSLSLPRAGSRPSFAVLTIDGKDVNAKLFAL